jgi:acyl-coenzyme A thioesterase 13
MPPKAFTLPTIDAPLLPSSPALVSTLTDLYLIRSLASPIYAFLLSHKSFAIIHASPGHVIARIPIHTNLLNSGGSLHGGAAATLVDWAGGMAISSVDGRRASGVSVDIHVEYLAPARMGDVIEIEGRAERVGGSLAYTTVGLYKLVNTEAIPMERTGEAESIKGERGEALVLGRHTKFVRGTVPKVEISGKESLLPAAS